MSPRRLEYSRTFNLGNYESEKIGLTIDLDEMEDLDEAFRTTKAKIFHLFEEGNLLEESKEAIEAIPRIDLAELEEVPFVKWQKDAQGNHIPAGKGEPGWTMNPAYFSSVEASPALLELIKAIQKADGKLELGEYLFSFSGDKDQFINRRPKGKSAKP
ncbi:MAG: hypothetical protein ACFFCW_25335 [Candidatus Hodarchaeota archaeon]